MSQHDPQHTSLSPYVGPSSNSTYWTFSTQGGFSGSPVIGSDGTVYAVSNDEHLYALNVDGSLKWSAYLGERGFAPAIGPNGTIYVPGVDHIFSFYFNGTQAWNLSMAGVGKNAVNLGVPLTVSPNGIVYSVNNGTLLAVSPNANGRNGSVRWSSPAPCYFSPAVLNPNGLVLCGGRNKNGVGELNEFSGENGTFKWGFNVGAGLSPSTITSSPAVIQTGAIFFVLSNGELFAIEPDGFAQNGWLRPGVTGAFASPVISPTGTIFVGGSDVVSFSPSSGAVLSSPLSCFQLNSTYCEPFSVSGMSMDSRGTLYVVQSPANGANSLVAMNPQSGAVSWLYSPDPGERIVGTPAIGSNGSLIFATGCIANCSSSTSSAVGHLYAIGRPSNFSLVTVSETGLLLNKPWSINFGGESYYSVTNTMQFSANDSDHSWSAPSIADGPGINSTAFPSYGMISVPASNRILLNYSLEYHVQVSAFPPSGGGLQNYSGWYRASSTLIIGLENVTPGYRFEYWESSEGHVQISNSSSIATSITVNGPDSIQAVFFPGLKISSTVGGSITYSLPPRSGTVDQNQSQLIYVPVGSTVLLTANASPGYYFAGWTNDSVPIRGSGLVDSIGEKVDSPINLTAVFVKSQSTSKTSSIAGQSSPSSTSTSSFVILPPAQQGGPYHGILLEAAIVVAVVVLAATVLYYFRSTRR